MDVYIAMSRHCECVCVGGCVPCTHKWLLGCLRHSIATARMSRHTVYTVQSLSRPPCFQNSPLDHLFPVSLTFLLFSPTAFVYIERLLNQLLTLALSLSLSLSLPRYIS